MRVVVTAVGQRTEHWTDLFALLGEQPGLQVRFVLADVSPLTERTMREHVSARPGLSCVVTRHLLTERRSGHMASVVFAPGALRRAVPERPDLVHVIGEAAYLSTRQVLRWRRRTWPEVPVTLYAAQNVVIDFPFPFPVLERQAYAAVDHALPITPAALHVLRAKGYRGPGTVVPLGVDTDRFTAGERLGSRAFTVGFVGRLEPHKGIADLLSATERLGCRLVVVGRGSLLPMVRAAAARAPERIRVVDWVDHDELPGLLRGLDVLTLPSAEVVQHNVAPWIGIPLREQFGRSLVEAMACGVPVVGSDVGEIAHVIGDAGLVYRAGDVDGFVMALGRIRDDTVLAGRLSRAGHRRARDEFGWDRIAGRLTAVWSAVVEQARSAGPPPAPGDPTAAPPGGQVRPEVPSPPPHPSTRR